MGSICTVCCKPAAFQCAGCHYTRYCGVACQRKEWKAYHKIFCFAFDGHCSADELLQLLKPNPQVMLYERFWNVNSETIRPRVSEFFLLASNSLPIFAPSIEGFIMRSGAHDAHDAVEKTKQFLNLLFDAARFLVVNKGRYPITPNCDCVRCISARDYIKARPLLDTLPIARVFRWSGE